MQTDDKDSDSFIVASWAPADPRDKTQDPDSTLNEKAVGMIRIFASMHPVLNLFVLSVDAIRKKSKLARLTLFVLRVGILMITYYFIAK